MSISSVIFHFFHYFWFPHPQVQARDDDSAENARLTYAIRKGDKRVFQIGQNDGVIKAKVALDREEKATYELTIVAVDSGKLKGKMVDPLNSPLYNCTLNTPYHPTTP